MVQKEPHQAVICGPEYILPCVGEHPNLRAAGSCSDFLKLVLYKRWGRGQGPEGPQAWPYCLSSFTVQWVSIPDTHNLNFVLLSWIPRKENSGNWGSHKFYYRKSSGPDKMGASIDSSQYNRSISPLRKSQTRMQTMRKQMDLPYLPTPADENLVSCWGCSQGYPPRGEELEQADFSVQEAHSIADKVKKRWCLLESSVFHIP